MRTTLTLDDDVAAALERLRKAKKLSLKRAVNETLRRGLAQANAPAAAPRRQFRTQPLPLGSCLVGNVDNIAEVLAVAEGEAFK